mgnify:CR=1 FL=1
MKVSIYTLGCKVNLYESEVIINEFKKKGYEIVPFESKSDISNQTEIFTQKKLKYQYFYPSIFH